MIFASFNDFLLVFKDPFPLFSMPDLIVVNIAFEFEKALLESHAFLPSNWLLLSPHGDGRRDIIDKALRRSDLLHIVAGDRVFPPIWERVHELGTVHSQLFALVFMVLEHVHSHARGYSQELEVVVQRSVSNVIMPARSSDMLEIAKLTVFNLRPNLDKGAVLWWASVHLDSGSK